MQDVDWDKISSCAGLLCLATAVIYCGAFDSLPSTARNNTTRKKSLIQDDDDEQELIPDRMSSSDAWLAPIVGSVALFGMYVVVTYLGEEWVNRLLGWYFSIMGVLSVWKSTVSLAKFVIGRERWRSFAKHRLIWLKGPLAMVDVSLRTPALLLFPVGMLASILYNVSSGSHGSALWTDALALSFSHSALSILKLDSFRTGCILLSGLFFYDVYWVFGSDVMLKVATSLDVPIKLLWPKSTTFDTKKGFTMLGLGDVVVPGIYIALALRYDHARAEKMGTSIRTPYFFVTLAAYVVGLIATMTVMHTFGKAQPALLYLSPACILSLVSTAVMRGELEDVWRWSDDPKLSEKKTAQEASAASRAFPAVENGNTTPQPNNGADGSDHVGGDVTEKVEEGREEAARGRKRRNRGKDKVRIDDET